MKHLKLDFKSILKWAKSASEYTEPAKLDTIVIFKSQQTLKYGRARVIAID